MSKIFEESKEVEKVKEEVKEEEKEERIQLDEPVEEKPKKGKHKKPMSAERKAKLTEQLKKARETPASSLLLELSISMGLVSPSNTNPPQKYGWDKTGPASSR